MGLESVEEACVVLGETAAEALQIVSRPEYSSGEPGSVCPSSGSSRIRVQMMSKIVVSSQMVILGVAMVQVYKLREDCMEGLQ